MSTTRLDFEWRGRDGGGHVTLIPSGMPLTHADTVSVIQRYIDGSAQPPGARLRVDYFVRVDDAIKLSGGTGLVVRGPTSRPGCECVSCGASSGRQHDGGRCGGSSICEVTKSPAERWFCCEPCARARGYHTSKLSFVRWLDGHAPPVVPAPAVPPAVAAAAIVAAPPEDGRSCQANDKLAEAVRLKQIFEARPLCVTCGAEYATYYDPLTPRLGWCRACEAAKAIPGPLRDRVKWFKLDESWPAAWGPRTLFPNPGPPPVRPAFSGHEGLQERYGITV